MKKMVTFEHLDTGDRMQVEYHIYESEGRWTGEIHQLGGAREGDRSPTFYGTTAEQAERQLDKLFEKEYDRVEEQILEG